MMVAMHLAGREVQMGVPLLVSVKARSSGHCANLVAPAREACAVRPRAPLSLSSVVQVRTAEPQ